jgi:hypothetical protein
MVDLEKFWTPGVVLIGDITGSENAGSEDQASIAGVTGDRL